MSSGMLKTYNHHHAWLLFTSLALSFAGVVNQPRKQGEFIEVKRKLPLTPFCSHKESFKVEYALHTILKAQRKF